MPKITYSNKLPPLLKLLMNLTAFLAWITGSLRDSESMKRRVRLGFDGSVTDDVIQYDRAGSGHYTKIASELLKNTDLKGKEVLDVGCGTGILSRLVLERGAKKLDSGDLSAYMLGQWRRKAAAQGYTQDQVAFHQIDSECLPFDENRFDVVVSSMMLGMVPDQKKALAEMKRVLRPGGVLALSTQGPELYYEGTLASTVATLKSFSVEMMAYRLEFWALNERGIKRALKQVGFRDIRTNRLTWQDDFESTDKAYEFVASTSSMWWFGKLKPEKIPRMAHKIRETYKRRGVTKITQDVTFAYAAKPAVSPCLATQ